MLISLLLASSLGSANAALAGLAWANGLWVPMGGFNAPGTSISSYYTWSPNPVVPSSSLSPIFNVPFDFIPMIWGCSDGDVSGFNAAMKSNFSNVKLTPGKEILAFNEPDLKGQADCSPERAADVWKSSIEPLKAKGYRLGSPAVTGGGKEWMQRWFRACEGGCDPDFIAVHWVSQCW